MSRATISEDTDDYRSLFLNDTPLLDVRAPVEFSKGAFPSAQNLPLLNDIERQRIGTCYQQKGQQAAIKMGHELVRNEVKAARLKTWQEFTRHYPEGYLYCFRGGLRSQIVQQWLADSGFDYPRVTAGYKAMRRFLIDTLESAIVQCPLTTVAGMTGTGKTEVIVAIDNALDLEDCAHHRGSSFGRHATSQPSQIDFENRLAIAALKLRTRGHFGFTVEDESRLIGRCFVPPSLQKAIKAAPLVWLEDSLEGRVNRILKNYIVDMLAEYKQLYPQDPEQAFTAFAEYLRDSLSRIRKRLGGELFAELNGLLDMALIEQQRSKSIDAHRIWITGLLNDYYDPMYNYQRGIASRQILFQGEQQAVIEYLSLRGRSMRV
jgi:tRNA 2-selenouridine synthase